VLGRRLCFNADGRISIFRRTLQPRKVGSTREKDDLAVGADHSGRHAVQLYARLGSGFSGHFRNLSHHRTDLKSDGISHHLGTDQGPLPDEGSVGAVGDRVKADGGNLCQPAVVAVVVARSA